MDEIAEFDLLLIRPVGFILGMREIASFRRVMSFALLEIDLRVLELALALSSGRWDALRASLSPA